MHIFSLNFIEGSESVICITIKIFDSSDEEKYLFCYVKKPEAKTRKKGRISFTIGSKILKCFRNNDCFFKHLNNWTICFHLSFFQYNSKLRVDSENQSK